MNIKLPNSNRRTFFTTIASTIAGIVALSKLDSAQIISEEGQASIKNNLKHLVSSIDENFIPVTVCGCKIKIEYRFYYVPPKNVLSYLDIIKESIKQGAANAIGENHYFTEVCPYHRARFTNEQLKPYSFFRLGGTNEEPPEKDSLYYELRRNIRHTEVGKKCGCHLTAWYDSREEPPAFFPMDYPGVTKSCKEHEHLSLLERFNLVWDNQVYARNNTHRMFKSKQLELYNSINEVI